MVQVGSRCWLALTNEKSYADGAGAENGCDHDHASQSKCDNTQANNTLLVPQDRIGVLEKHMIQDRVI